MRKGLSPIFESLFLVVIAVSMSTLVAGWLSGLSTERSAYIKNSTETQLQCQFNNLYIKTASYNCNNNCAAGISHTVTVTIVNSGRSTVEINKIYIQNTTGTVFSLDINRTSISTSSSAIVSNVSTAACTGINRTIEKIIVSSTACPNTAFDSITGSDVTFTNC